MYTKKACEYPNPKFHEAFKWFGEFSLVTDSYAVVV